MNLQDNVESRVLWPIGWRVTHQGSGIMIAVRQRRLHGLIFLASGVLVGWILASVHFSQFDTGPQPAPGKIWTSKRYFWRELLFPPLNRPLEVDSYVAIIFRLTAIGLSAAGVWLLSTCLTFEFQKGSVIRTVRLLKKQWRQTLCEGSIEFSASYSDRNAREESIWQWAIDLRDGRRPWRRLYKAQSGYSARYGKEVAYELGRVTGWDVTEEFYWADPPDTSSGG